MKVINFYLYAFYNFNQWVSIRKNYEASLYGAIFGISFLQCVIVYSLYVLQPYRIHDWSKSNIQTLFFVIFIVAYIAYYIPKRRFAKILKDCENNKYSFEWSLFAYVTFAGIIVLQFFL